MSVAFKWMRSRRHRRKQDSAPEPQEVERDSGHRPRTSGGRIGRLLELAELVLRHLGSFSAGERRKALALEILLATIGEVVLLTLGRFVLGTADARRQQPPEPVSKAH